MRDINILLEPFNFISIIDCKISKHLNDHSVMNFVCRISSDQENIIMNTDIKNTFIKLKVIDEDNKSIILFSGIIKSFSLKKSVDTRILHLNCISSTYLMDIIKKTRIFQNTSSTYSDILNYISVNNGYEFITNIDDTNIGKLIVQYNETDFEFIKRLASHFNTCISPSYLTDGIKYFFGLPESSKNFNLEYDYVIKKEIIEDLRKDAEKLPFSIEQGATIIKMISRNIYEIGDYTIFNGQKYIISNIYTNYIGNELKHTYILKEKLGQYISKYYNTSIIGSSLSAKIDGVSSDKVRVCVMTEGIQNSKSWLPYSTVYSSPDGTGWYCMPEIGDSVRIYFPTEKEHHGYIISAVHVSNNDCNSNITKINQFNYTTSNQSKSNYESEAPRSNPDYKSFKSKHGKEMLFTPNSILFTNNNGMKVEILDDEGISIISDKKVNIISEEEINIESTTGSIKLMGQKSVLLEKLKSQPAVQSVGSEQSAESEPSNTKLELSADDNILLYGAKIKMQ